MIFSDYLSGMGKTAIMKKLIEKGKPTKLGGTWSDGAIHSILRNEKYTGNLLLQKTFNQNHMNKKKCKNNGELAKYYVNDSHEAIIKPEIFEQVQEEIRRRSEDTPENKDAKPEYPFTGKLTCMGCGKTYRRKINHSGTKYAKPVWICTTFNNFGKESCDSKHVPESVLLNITAEVLNLQEFDNDAFKEQIKEIRISSPNTLVYIFSDEHIATRTWEHKSRKNSWSDEQKQEARERELKRREAACKK